MSKIITTILILFLIFSAESHAQALPSLPLNDLIKLAAAGDAHAQLIVGARYEAGIGVKSDIHEAIKWYEKSAKQKNTGALEQMAIIYLRGRGVAADSQKAIKLFTESANHGSITAISNLGVIYRDGLAGPIDLDETFKWFLKGAHLGDAGCQFDTGMMLLRGEGVKERSSQQAEYWIEKAANQNLTVAQSKLGLFYFWALNGTRNDKEAVKLFTKAALKGDVIAQHFLGIAHRTGRGVVKNEIDALAWFYISASEDSAESLKFSKDMETELGKENTIKAQERAKEIKSTIKEI
jgi:uncharacterized protein